MNKVNYKVTIIYYTNLDGRALKVENYSIDAINMMTALQLAGQRLESETLDTGKCHTLGIVEVHAVKARV